MKINVLLPGNTNKATGGYKVIYEYCNKLSCYGHDVIIYYYYGPMFERLRMPETIRLLLVKIFSETVGPGLWFKLEKKIKKKVIKSATEIVDGDIVIATSIGTVKDVYELPSRCGKKFYFIQDFENWNHSNEEVYATYNLGMTNIVVAKWLKDIVDKHSSSPSYLVTNCINTDVFYDKGEKRRKHSIVFHYRSAEYKGPKYALQAIEKLHEKYNDLTVDVISSEEKPVNLPDFCNFHHSISALEVAEINNKSEVFMCTTVEEGFGLPGLEAMACGCAVVSSSYRGVLEYAIDGENAVLSPVRDAEAMVKNIEQLFEDDFLRKKIARNGIKTGIEKSLDKSSTCFEKILFDNLM